MPSFFTGIDLHKRSLTATTLDAEGSVVASAKMPCHADALRAHFAQIPGDHRAAVECTTGWYWVYDALASEVDLHLAHAKGVKAIAAAKVKTDSADARMLAHRLRADLLPEAHMISDDLRPLRDVLRKGEDFNGRFKGRSLSRTKQEQWPLLPSPASITGDGEETRPPSAGMGGE
jgi:hypothetical protein